MLQEFEELLDETAYRTATGILDFTLLEHCNVLEREMKKTKHYSDDFITEFVKGVHAQAYLLMEAESAAALQAHKKGLEHVGYGYWANKAGDIVAKTEGDKLITLSPKDRETAKQKISSKKTKTDKNGIPQKNVKKSLEPEKPKFTAFKATSPDIKDIGKIISSTKMLTKELSKTKFESDSDKKIIAGFLGGLKEGDFETLSKYGKIINKYVRIADSPMPKLYVARIANDFSQGKRGKVEPISVEMREALKKFGLERAAAVTTKTGGVSIVKSKDLAANSVFVNEEGKTNIISTPIKKTETSISIGKHTINSLPEVDIKTLVERIQLDEIYKGRGLDDAEAKKQAAYAVRAIRKHNEVIKELKNKLPDKTSFLDPLPGVSPITEDGRKKIADAALDSINKKITVLYNGKPSKEALSIQKELEGLKKSKNYTEDALRVFTHIANSPELTRGASDLAELITYTRRLREGQIVYLPAEANFPLVDVIAMSDLKLSSKSSPKEIVNAMNLISVSVDLRSIKRGAGAASALPGKIDMSVFKNTHTRKQLRTLADTFGQIWGGKKMGKLGQEEILMDIKGAESSILAISKEIGFDVKKVMNDPRFKKDIENVYKSNVPKMENPNKKQYVKQLQLYNLAGKVVEYLYNKDVDIQLFSNERYTDAKNVRLDVTDGVHSISHLNFIFNSNWREKNGKPENTYPTRFYHVDNEQKQG